MGKPWMVLRIFLCTRSRISISVLVRVHNSAPNKKIGMQYEEYSLREVAGCRPPNLVLIAFRAKKALRPAVALSVVLAIKEGWTVLRMPIWWASSLSFISASPMPHVLSCLFLKQDCIVTSSDNSIIMYNSIPSRRNYKIKLYTHSLLHHCLLKLLSLVCIPTEIRKTQ